MKKDNHKSILSHKANDHIQHIKNKNHHMEISLILS